MSCTLAATFNGYIRTTYDALIVFEACLLGELRYAPRRLTEKERRELIQSGNVFIYNEHRSGMKRWTDSVSWSPSRILENFLVYRELQDHKGKRTLKKRKQMANGAIKRLNTTNKDWSLIGSLVDSYDFKQEGLVKKTISITLQGVSHHLVSYYKCEDIRKRLFTTPSQHSTLRSIIPRAELMTHYFKVPVAGRTSTNGTDDHSHGPASMDDGYILKHEAIPMDYHPDLMGLHYTHQQPALAYMQLQQHDQQQSGMPYYLPFYSEEQQEVS
ncbi:Global transcription regulator sge1 [Fusarium falciforme]|uniref:Global transcription regulator sge1 n=1 Tax=Fusarium falciforme TaxID=195108 RepID=A0A9W8QTB9_9HYPO|nr:Global transcription regulator sge1 [Fusarium falciforme]KAJ4235457.1 Global transcription regulator sge1 [Fusarium falciforme]